MEMEITMFDNEGKIVVHELIEAQTCTQEQVNEAVFMIERGTPAYIAMMLAQQPHPTRRASHD